MQNPVVNIDQYVDIDQAPLLAVFFPRTNKMELGFHVLWTFPWRGGF